MSRMWNATRSVIGIDIGAREIKAVQLVRGAKAVSIAASARFTRHDASLSDREMELLIDVLERRGFTGNHVVIAAPASQVVTSVLELPPRSSGAPLDRIAHVELGRVGKLDNAGYESAFWDLPAPVRASAATNVLAVALCHDHADVLIDAFEAGGLTVDRIDTQAWALARACSAQSAATPAITAVLDIGWDATRLLLIHEGLPVFHRTLGGTGIKSIAKQMGDEMGVDQAAALYLMSNVSPGEQDGGIDELQSIIGHFIEGLSSEMNNSLAYAGHRFPNHPLTRMLLVGGGAKLPGMASRFATRYEIEAMSVSLGDVAHCTGDARDIVGDCGLLLALGLAMPVGDRP